MGRRVTGIQEIENSDGNVVVQVTTEDEYGNVKVGTSDYNKTGWSNTDRAYAIKKATEDAM